TRRGEQQPVLGAGFPCTRRGEQQPVLGAGFPCTRRGGRGAAAPPGAAASHRAHWPAPVDPAGPLAFEFEDLGGVRTAGHAYSPQNLELTGVRRGSRAATLISHARPAPPPRARAAPSARAP